MNQPGGIRRRAGKWSARLSRIGVREDRASVIIEFAMILPVLITAILGSYWAVIALDASRKNEIVALRVSDIVSRHLQISRTRLAELHTAIGAIYEPHDRSTATLTVSLARVVVSGGARRYAIVWRAVDGVLVAVGGGPRGVLNLDTSEERVLTNIPAGTHFVFVRALLVHRPVISRILGFLPQDLNLKAMAYNLASDPDAGVPIR